MVVVVVAAAAAVILIVVTVVVVAVLVAVGVAAVVSAKSALPSVVASRRLASGSHDAARPTSHCSKAVRIPTATSPRRASRPPAALTRGKAFNSESALLSPSTEIPSWDHSRPALSA